MNDSENLTKYFEHLAQHHASIAHNPSATTMAAKRFFQLETIELLTSGQFDFMNWVMILEGHEGRYHDARADHFLEADMMGFMILKHAPKNDVVARRATYIEAFNIGTDIIKLINQNIRNCGAPLFPPPVGVRIPFSMPLNQVRWHMVGPLFRDAYGYRFTVDLFTGEPVKMVVDPARFVA